MKVTDYICDLCEDRVGSCSDPILVYIVAGHVNGGGEMREGLLDPYVEKLLRRPVPRMELCASCFKKHISIIAGS